MIREVHTRPILIFGCGNTLFGDDGFGPAVARRLLREPALPPSACVVDAGTSVREFLFDLLLRPRRPESLFIVDAADQPGRRPGELFELDLDGIAPQKASDFSLHQYPSVNLLKELRSDAGVNVRVLAVQAGDIPDRVRPGLSPEVAQAVSEACRWLIRVIEGSHDRHSNR
ncbi:MAG: hydrogenase maturation protease [Thermodesulfobacteriota bacterium]|nr:hydrogenase maturation protease [Thermodesulfobacteriota bacterium]